MNERTPQTQESPPPQPMTGDVLASYRDILQILRQPIQHRTDNVLPTYTPKNWLECFVAYDDGLEVGLYIFINGTWYTLVLDS